ncbi:MAG: hypothetical protein IAF38_16985 [Bacteroidia bacterium]|nr:hypothetical protein [Bacteroidia bacterium]
MYNNFLFAKKIDGKKPRRYLPAVVIIVCIIGFVGKYLFDSYWQCSLKENGVITRCTVYEYKPAASKERSKAHYTIIIKDREVIFDGDLISSLEKKWLFVSLPLIYDSTNINNHRLLLSRKDFSELQIPFPDSLKWLDSFGIK